MAREGGASTDRWLRVGQSNDPDARAAGAAAARAALGEPDPRLLVVFCSDAYDLAALLGGIRDGSRRRAARRLLDRRRDRHARGPGDASVVVTALGGDGFSVATAAATRRPPTTCARPAPARPSCMTRRRATARTGCCCCSPTGSPATSRRSSRGAYGVVGAEVPLVGGCAGDDLKMTGDLPAPRRPRSCATRSSPPRSPPTRRSASACATAGAGSASRCSSRAATATASTRLDDRPALDVYLERLGAPAEAAHRPARPSPASPSRTRSGSAGAAARRCASSARPTSRTARSSASPRSRRAGSPGSWRATTTRCWRPPTRPAPTRWPRSAGSRRWACSPSTASPAAASSATRASQREVDRIAEHADGRAGRRLLHLRRDRPHARDRAGSTTRRSSCWRSADDGRPPAALVDPAARRVPGGRLVVPRRGGRGRARRSSARPRRWRPRSAPWSSTATRVATRRVPASAACRRPTARPPRSGATGSALDVPGVGPCAGGHRAVEDDAPGALVLARSGDAFTREESACCAGWRACSLAVTCCATAVERGCGPRRAPGRGERAAARHARERQRLLEQLSSIQRLISHRAPLQSVLDAIAGAAGELLGDERRGAAARRRPDDPRARPCAS